MPNDIPTIPDFLRESELAQRWRLTMRTLQRWRQDGTGPEWLKIKGRVIYPRTAVLEWERQSRRSRAGGSRQ